MFGFGGDDGEKDELEENMDEIKNLINEGKTPQEAAEQFQQANEDFDGEDVKSKIDEFEESEAFGGDEVETPQGPPEDFDPSPVEDTQNSLTDTQDSNSKKSPSNAQQPPSQNQSQPRKPQSTDQSTQPRQRNLSQKQTQQSQRNQSEDQTQNSPASEQGRTRREPRQGQSKEEKLDNAIPKPAETKKIDVPDINKGPLFIRQQKFEAAQRMIEEMRYLSDEIEEVVNHLEEGIREDHRTEQEAREILHNIEENRTGVQDIISPKEESE